MNDVPSILIVDSNEPFAVMLQEGLEREGAYRASVKTDSDDALHALSENTFDLAIVDLGIDDAAGLDGPSLARELRQLQNDLRLILIPLSGDELPSGLSDLSVQGTLSKPFFLPDLPGRIDEALTQPIILEPKAETESEKVEELSEESEPKKPDFSSEQDAVEIAELFESPRERNQAITQELEMLSQEINAEAVILTRGEHVLASAGRIKSDDIDTLAQIVSDNWRASDRVAQILGRAQHCFEQSMEGGEHMLYSLSVTEKILISVILSADVRLGIIRHQVKQVVIALQSLIA
jgi:DNA-binding response OmpR family regulator